jgi:CheY-like chemotaxis protein
MTTDVSILIVDDDDEVRAALFDELSRDYRVEAATCGEEAFAALAARSFDVVISDLKMPDHDGIEVLTFARDQHPDVIRILLTGYVDERAHAELLKPGAPFKVGKPWYDEIEVVLRRALEQRARTRHLSSSLESAIGLADIDLQLAAIVSLEELGQVLVIHLTRLSGVDIAWATCDGRRLAGVCPTLTTGGWRIEQSLDDRGRVVVGAVGLGPTTRELVEHIIAAGQRRAGVLTAAAQPPVGPTRSRTDELLRHATIGTLAATLLHDMASMLQVVDGAVALLVESASSAAAPELVEAAADVQATAREAFELFVSVRKFLSDGVVKAKRITSVQLTQRVVRHCGAAVRERARLQVGSVADFWLEIADTLFVRSIADIATAAATLAPAGATIELSAVADGEHATIAIRDDGPGVPARLVPSLFEPLSWNRPSELPVRLAIAAYVLRCLGATVSYRRDGGSCFTIAVPRQAPS